MNSSQPLLYWQMVNDIVYHGPVDHLIRHHSEVNTTYQYVFGYRGAYTGTIIDDWMGKERVITPMSGN